MGASFNTRLFKDEPKEKITKRWNELVQESRLESGCSYSGEIGMMGLGIVKWHDLQLKKRHDAEEVLSRVQQKWEPAEAVSFLEKGKKYWVIGGWCSS